MVDLPRNNLEYGDREQRVGYAVVDAIQDLFGSAGTDLLQVADVEYAYYRANTNGTGYSTDDLIREIIAVDGTSTWFNVTTQSTITPAPPQGDLDFIGGSGNPLEDGRVAVALPQDQVVQINPPVDTAAAYAANDVLFAPIELTNLPFAAGRTVKLVNIVTSEIGTNRVSMDLLFFDREPTNGTYTFNTPIALDNGDIPFVIGAERHDNIKVFGANAVGRTNESETGLILDGNGTQSIWVMGIARKALTFAAATDLHISFGFEVK